MSTIGGRQHLSNYIGQIGETLVRKFLEKEGFTVMSYEALCIFVPHIVRASDISPLVKMTKVFLGSKKEDFINLIEALNRIYIKNPHPSFIKNVGSEHKRRSFDFMVKKEKDFYVVEVKTNKAQLSKKNEEELKLAKKYGFIPMVVKTKVTLIADYKDISIKIL